MSDIVETTSATNLPRFPFLTSGLAMPCYIRMKRTFLQGLLWLYLFGFGFMALSLEPGFLDFDNLPDTNFTCVGKVIGGYYADLETNCQMFHVCTIGQLDEPMDIRFLCLNGTVFDQETRVCERIDEVDCTKSEQFYSLNLELYGNSQPSNLEEISETEQPLIIKSTLPTTTTTTEPTRKTTRTPFYTTVTSPTNGGSTQQLNAAHHFSLINSNSADIRFNPEEINISLHPGAPPDIRTKPHVFYSDRKEANSEKTVVVTTHRSVVSTHRPAYENGGGREAITQKSLSGYNQATPGDINFGFTLRNANLEDYNTEDSEGDGYHYHTEFRPSQEYSVPHHNSQRQSLHQPQQYTSSTFRNEYTPTTSHNNNYQSRSSTTARNLYIESLKPPALDHQNQYHHPQSEKPQRLQLPLPTLPPLTFSSPAPFSLQQRFESKRYTKDHFPPPRIVVSASASVSDNSGRRLNYSLGTIGTAPLFKHPPFSYDEYKDEDVGLDPFYHDVQKVKSSRKKRSLPQPKRRKRSDRSSLKHSDIIKNDDDAIHVLKFLFDWYRNEKTNPARYTTPISAPLNREGIVSINDELSPDEKEHINGDSDDDNIDFKFKTSDVFNKKSRYSIVGNGGASINQKEVEKINNVKEEFTIMENEDPENGDEIFQHEEDYVNDNFEPLAYRNNFETDKKISRDHRHELNENVGRHDYKYKYANEKEHLVDDVNQFSKGAGFGKSSHSHKYENEPSPDYEREFNEERERERTDEHVSTSFDDENENDTNFSVPNEYVDDNVEPIYYKERNEQKEIGEKNSWKTDETTEEPQTRDFTTETFGSTEILEKKAIIDSTSTLSYSKLPDQEETTTEYQEQMNTQDAINVNPKLSENITPSTIPSETTEVTSHPTTTIADAFETTLTTEAPTTTTRRAKNSRRRGRRKYHSAEAKDKEIDFKKALIEKLIEKPFRAKDDYDFLRTVHIHTTTTGEGVDGNSSTEMNTEAAAPIITEHESVHFVPTLTEKVVVTESSTSETTTRSFTESINERKETESESKLSDIFVTTSSTTVANINSKRRRGKQRNHVDLNRNKSSRRRKPTKSRESKEYYPSSNRTYSGSVDIITNTPLEIISSKSIGGISVFEHDLEQKMNSSRNENDVASQTPVAIVRSETDNDTFTQNHKQLSTFHPEVIETTTKHVSAPKGRGKTRFLNIPDLDQQSTVIDISRTTPTSPMKQMDLMTTASLATTEHFTEDFNKSEEELYSSSTGVYSKDNIASSERIEDIYATSFVPTTESIHITKKKQLKDNLLHSDLIPTTESSLDMNTFRITDVTEEFNDETTSTTPARTEKLLELFEGIETSTGGYISDLTTIDVDEFERTTAFLSKFDENEANQEAHLIENNSVPIMSKDMHLLSIVVEEKVESSLLEKSTTELESTTNIPQELDKTTEGYIVTDVSTEDIASSYFESSTESLLKATEVEDDVTVDQVKLEEKYKTEALTSTTEIVTETSSVSAETKAPETSIATTLAIETTTTIANDYSQIPTTFEQTTFAPETTERTTTIGSYSRKERPNKRRPNYHRSSYRHRFSSEYSTRRPKARKQAVEDEIIDVVSRRGKKLTTERTTDEKDIMESLTEYPLMKSVHPTQAERTIVTTPFSRKTTVKKHFFFNCFGKPVDKFYPDLRDCRLFHYCTQGYNKNQLLDMKFVCDLNTFFDDEKLICTKLKPKRCL